MAEPAEVPGAGGTAAPRRWRGQRFLLVLAVLLLLASFYFVLPYLAATIFALLLGFLLRPWYSWLLKRVKKAPIAAGLMLLLVAVALVLPFVALGFALASEASYISSLVGDTNGFEQRLVGFLGGLGVSPGTAESLVEDARRELLAGVQGIVVPAATAVTTFFIHLIVFFILLYFVLVDGHHLVDYLRRVLPLDAHRRELLFDRTGERVKAILLGTVAIAFIQGGIAAVGWWVLGLPAPVLAGLAMFILELVPVVGAFVLLIPATVIAFATGDMYAGVGLLVLNFIIVGLVDDVARPYIIGRRSSVHPGVILLGIAGGLTTFGLAGLILGPLILSLVGPIIEAWSSPENQPLETPAN